MAFFVISIFFQKFRYVRVDSRVANLESSMFSQIFFGFRDETFFNFFFLEKKL